jgi:lysozyme
MHSPTRTPIPDQPSSPRIVAAMLVVDLSNNNAGPIDFRRVRENGIRGVYLKCTEGRTYADRYFSEWRQEAQVAGLRTGAYHFARPDNNSPDAEAEWFLAHLPELTAKDWRPCLDFEVRPADADWARAFNQAVHAGIDLLPLLYTYPSFAAELHAEEPIGSGLWLASYSRNDGSEHPFAVPAPWRSTVGHQFTSNARVPGIPGRVDLSTFTQPEAVDTVRLP